MANTKDKEGLDLSSSKAIEEAFAKGATKSEVLKELLKVNEEHRNSSQKAEIRRLKQEKKLADKAEAKEQALHDLVENQRDAVERLNDTTRTSLKELGSDGRTMSGKQLEAIAQQNGWSKERLQNAKENAREQVDLSKQIKAREEFLNETTGGVLDATQDAELNEMKRHQTRLKSQQRVLQDNTKLFGSLRATLSDIPGAFNQFIDTQKESITKGELSAKGLAGSFKDDFTRLAGPLGGILQQIPFLGSIAKLGKSILLRMLIAMRDAWVRYKNDPSRSMLAFWKKKDIQDKRQKRRTEVKKAKADKTKPVEKDKDGGGLSMPMGMKIAGIAKALPLLAAPIRILGMAFASLGPLAGPIVVGAGGLALAIAALGVGVGVTLAAMALGVTAMGLALPVLSKGFESFADLPADDIRYNISEIGKSMGWLLAMAWITPLASLAGALSGGLPKLAESFKAFDSDNIDGPDISTNIQALGEGMDALSKITTGSLGAAFKGFIADMFTDDKGPGPLEKMANDLKAFESLIGEKLMSVGPGITAIGKGMEAMSAGEGGFWSGVGEGIQSFFGGGTVETLQKVAELPDTLESKGNAIQTVANSFSVLGTALDGISSDSLDKLADSMEILSDAEVTITPSVQVANLANMMIPQAMVTGGAIAAAAGAGVTSGGSGLMITNVSNVTNQNNQVKNRNIRATGSMRSDSNFSQVH